MRDSGLKFKKNILVYLDSTPPPPKKKNIA